MEELLQQKDTIVIGTNVIRVWISEPSQHNPNRHVMLSVHNGDSRVMSSLMLRLDNEKQVSQLADNLNLALAIVWPKEF